MLASQDFKERLNVFKKYNARYLIVGGYAVKGYAEPRFTKDLEIFVACDKANALAVYAALKEFGALLTNLVPEDFSQPEYFYQMGIAPLRIDVLMSMPGVDFEKAWQNREIVCG